MTVYVDTLHIHHGVYTAYAPWRTCHAYVELHMQSNIAILAVKGHVKEYRQVICILKWVGGEVL